MRWLFWLVVSPLIAVVLLVGAFLVDDARLVGIHRLHYAEIRTGMAQGQVEGIMGPPYSDMHEGNGRVYHGTSTRRWNWGERDPAHDVKWHVTVDFDDNGRVAHKEGSFCIFD